MTETVETFKKKEVLSSAKLNQVVDSINRLIGKMDSLTGILSVDDLNNNGIPDGEDRIHNIEEVTNQISGSMVFVIETLSRIDQNVISISDRLTTQEGEQENDEWDEV